MRWIVVFRAIRWVGYGAIKIAIKHPEIFGAVYALSACCMVWGGGISPSNPAWEKTIGFHGLGDVAAAQDYIVKSGFNFNDGHLILSARHYMQVS